jgi:hypothetical protein
MCVTWDRTMIAVASELGDSGWVVTPNEASDLVQSSVDFSSTRLTSLAHALTCRVPSFKIGNSGNDLIDSTPL